MCYKQRVWCLLRTNTPLLRHSWVLPPKDTFDLSGSYATIGMEYTTDVHLNSTAYCFVCACVHACVRACVRACVFSSVGAGERLCLCTSMYTSVLCTDMYAYI